LPGLAQELCELAPTLEGCGTDYQQVLGSLVQIAPSFSLRGGTPEIMRGIIAKGLGAGYQPIGAVLVHGRIVDAMRAGSGFFQHGHTYLGHPVACAAALAVQEHIRPLLPQVQAHGEYLMQALHSRLDTHPKVGDIRGRGLFLGIELVADRASKNPLPAKAKVHAQIKASALERGLLCYPMGGTVDGQQGDHVLLAPPFICTIAQLDELVDKLGATLEAVLAAQESPVNA
jgi:adenosylmethionine-8-amino-7-oxononanoate aminotransferase